MSEENEIEQTASTPFYLKKEKKFNKQIIVNLFAILSLVFVGLALFALGVFQFFYAERASQYFGLTEYEYLHFLKWTFTSAQLPAFGVAGGLIVIALLNAFRYEAYYAKHPRSIITKEAQPFLYLLNRFLPIEWSLNTFKGFFGYRPNDVTWIAKILFAVIEGYFIYVALSVAKASNPIVHQLGLMVAIGLPVLSYIGSHGFAWLFFYVFDYNNYRSKMLNDDNSTLQKKNLELEEKIKALEDQQSDLNIAIAKAKQQLDDSLDTLSATDDEVDRLNKQKSEMSNQIGAISNGHHHIDLENQVKSIQDENQHLKEKIETNLRFIETALSNTRESLGFHGSAIYSSGKSYDITDPDFLSAEMESDQSDFVINSRNKSAKRRSN